VKKIIILLVTFFTLFNHNAFSLDWEQDTIKDEFKGSSFDYIASKFVKPNASLKFPYMFMKARMVRLCENLNDIIIIDFKMNPNLINGKLDTDLISHHTIDIKLDGKFYKYNGEIETDSPLFIIKKGYIDRILNSKEFVIQFQHHAGTRHYTFDLSSMPKECKK